VRIHVVWLRRKALCFFVCFGANYGRDLREGKENIRQRVCSRYEGGDNVRPGRQFAFMEKIIGGPLLEAPTTPPFNAASIPLDADDVLSQRPISPPLRQPRLPTPKCVARKNVLAAQHIAQITAVDEYAPFEFEPARVGSPMHCKESPSTEYEAFEPARVDEPFVPAVDVASENVSAWTAYPTAPWHTAATSSFHRELSANSTTGAAALTSTMWHDVEENTERSEAYTCSRLNTAGRPRPRGGKKREREASHHGSNCPPRVQSTRPAGIVVAPPNRS